MTKTKQKNRISDKQFKTLLIKELAKPNSKANLKTTFYELLRTKYSIAKERALELHDRCYSEYLNMQNERLANEMIEKEKEALKLTIKDKNEHAQKLVNEIERLQEIRAGKALKVGSTVLIATFQDEIRAKAEIRAILKQIGDWYGFNAPTKSEITGKDGKDLIATGFIVNISNNKKD